MEQQQGREEKQQQEVERRSSSRLGQGKVKSSNDQLEKGREG